jgi:fructose 1,6-bisphosphatase
VEHHRRIFLDLESEAESAQHLLGAVERFNIKRVWSRRSENRDAARVSEGLGEVLLAASTEKLAVITGGEYRGKDDPVLLAVEPLADALNLFMRDCFYMTQGDGRGSHFMFPTPLPCRDAIATVNSRAVAVSAWVSINSSGQICGLQDVFSDPIYETARDRAYRLNKAIWDAQGGNFIPVGVGSAKVEQSYPLAKTLARITAAESEFAPKSYHG